MRLIDADKAMKIISNRWLNSNGEKAKCYHDLFNILKNQPTAYDIDKVVEELEEYKTYSIQNAVMGIDVANKSIEIVKAGGKE